MPLGIDSIEKRLGSGVGQVPRIDDAGEGVGDVAGGLPGHRPAGEVRGNDHLGMERGQQGDGGDG